MTTIAYDGHTLASDSQINGEGSKEPYGAKKIWRIGDLLIGCCGEYSSALRFISWVKSGMKEDAPPKSLGDFGAIVIKKNGKPVFYEGSLQPFSLKGILAAHGSGGSYAMAAMLAGATAGEAVKIACRLDPSSGGAVQRLEIGKRRSKRAS